MHGLTFDLLVGIALLAYMFLLTVMVHKNKIGTTVAGMLLLAGVLAIRLCYISAEETGPDVSIWLASANTVKLLPDSLWSLLTTNEARPLVVLPLVALHQLGMPLSYPAADIAGITMYGLSFILAIQVMRKFVSNTQAFLLSLPLFAALATASIIDYTSYNCQAPSLLVMMICLLALYKLYQQQLSMVAIAMVGILLGCLPLIKFQNAPAGVAIGVALCLLLIKRKKFGATLLLCTSALVPIALVALFFAQRGLWADFMNDYFNNYFFYSYKQDYAGDSFWHRYSPRRIISFVFRTSDSMWLLAGSFATLGLVAFYRKLRLPENAVQWFATIFLLLNFYAVIQSGWNTPHYLFYIWIPPALLIAALLQHAKTTQWIAYVLIGATALQTLHNQAFRKKNESAFLSRDKEIEQRITQLTHPKESIVVWGHADRYYVKTQRPMGVRLADTWWVVHPGALQPKRVAEYIYDLEKNKPKLIIDNTSGPDPHKFEMKKAHLHSLPDIAQYVDRHYTRTDSLHGAVFYLRKK